MIHKLTRSIIITLLILFIYIAPSIPANASQQVSSVKVLGITHQSENQLNQFAENSLTPQARQELQAVRQRRNRDIIQVLDQNQRAELDYYVRSGTDMEGAVKKLSLDRDQWDTIQAIVDFSRLKIKAILARHSLL